MNLAFVRRPLGSKKIDQWTLIALAIDAQLKVAELDWQLSHKRVNTHPSCRVSFEEWIKLLSDCGVLLSGEKFYTKQTLLFDAMPACWTKLSVEERHEAITICKNVYDLAELVGKKPEWAKEVVVGLAQFVKLEDVYKLRACHFISKIDPSVIVHDDGTQKEDVPEEVPKDGRPTCATQDQVVAKEAEAQASVSNALDFFHWQPKNLMLEHMKDKKNGDAQSKLFHHMTDYASQMMWNSSKKDVEPSAYLDASISDEQKELLRPSYKNTLQGFIMYDVKGKGAQNKLAKRRLDMTSGNVSSCSRCLNDPKHLKQIKEVNQLAATVAEVTADMDNEKEAQQVKATERKKVLKQKKAAVIAKEAAERAVELPKLAPIMRDFEEGRKDIHLLNTTLFPKPYLVKMLKCYYDSKPTGVAKKSKQEIYDEVIKCFETNKVATVPL